MSHDCCVALWSLISIGRALGVWRTWCLVTALWLFLAVPWVCLQFVIVVFPDHTHIFVRFFLTKQGKLVIYNSFISSNFSYCP